MSEAGRKQGVKEREREKKKEKKEREMLRSLSSMFSGLTFHLNAVFVFDFWFHMPAVLALRPFQARVDHLPHLRIVVNLSFTRRFLEENWSEILSRDFYLQLKELIWNTHWIIKQEIQQTWNPCKILYSGI